MNALHVPEITPEFRRRIRDRFPALSAKLAFLENAGGSQVPRVVADAIHRYFLETYVQLDAEYDLSVEATRTVEEAHGFTALLMNAPDDGKVVLGPSCSMLCKVLADAYAARLGPGDEVIVAEAGHEANVGPWVRLADRGVKVRTWPFDPDRMESPLEALDDLLNPRTRIVAVPHVSNLLGAVEPLKEITARAHAVGARVVADGVAYAPHRAMDVKDWDVDFYAYSAYKVYGPHMAALYGKNEAFAELTGPNHYFVPDHEVPYKFELGGVCHEGCAGLLALSEYLRFLAGIGEDAPFERDGVEAAFEVIARCEEPLIDRLVGFLRDRPGVRLVGPAVTDRSRVGTVSFVHERHTARTLARAAQEKGYAIRNGHMYAHRLCLALGLEPEDGVVRVSLVHYNTPEEIEGLIEVLDGVL